jgi:hypothetical protein
MALKSVLVPFGSGYKPAYSADGHAQHTGGFCLTLSATQQLPQQGEGFPVQLPGPPALPAPGPDRGLAVGLGSRESPLRAISATVIGFSLMRPSLPPKLAGRQVKSCKHQVSYNTYYVNLYITHSQSVIDRA